MIIVMTGGWTGIYTMRILRFTAGWEQDHLEAFGLMDSDEDYHKKALWRMEDYRRQGWRQWRDLIYTFEEDVRDPRDLREIVEEFLLPRVM